jgi:hypothetical protein
MPLAQSFPPLWPRPTEGRFFQDARFELATGPLSSSWPGLAQDCPVIFRFGNRAFFIVIPVARPDPEIDPAISSQWRDLARPGPSMTMKNGHGDCFAGSFVSMTTNARGEVPVSPLPN